MQYWLLCKVAVISEVPTPLLLQEITEEGLDEKKRIHVLNAF